jgi:hypothetical protein
MNKILITLVLFFLLPDVVFATRDNRVLNIVKSGAMTYFVEPSGVGIIKIGLDNYYFEFMSLGLETYTYYGKCNGRN